jgi:hypothetical protein
MRLDDMFKSIKTKVGAQHDIDLTVGPKTG